MTNTVSLSINLPTEGASRFDYLHCIATQLTAAQEQGNRDAAMALAGLLTLIDEGISYAEKSQAHFYNPAWGRTV